MTAYWLDGNALAGLLVEALGEDMTAVERRCEHCGDERALGAYRAYLGAGTVLRCAGAARSRGRRRVQRQLGWPQNGPNTVTVPSATPSV